MWISVKDRMPQPGENVVVCCGNQLATAFFDGIQFGSDLSDLCNDDESGCRPIPSHWMPIGDFTSIISFPGAGERFDNSRVSLAWKYRRLFANLFCELGLSNIIKDMNAVGEFWGIDIDVDGGKKRYYFTPWTSDENILSNVKWIYCLVKIREDFAKDFNERYDDPENPLTKEEMIKYVFYGDEALYEKFNAYEYYGDRCVQCVKGVPRGPGHEHWSISMKSTVE
jgi:hypothetical protein